MIYDTIFKYVTGVVDSLYKTDEMIVTDELLCLFFKEVQKKDKGDIQGFPTKPLSKPQVVKVLTKIIW